MLGLSHTNSDSRIRAGGLDDALSGRVHTLVSAALGAAHGSRRSKPLILILSIVLVSLLEVEDAREVEAAVLDLLVEADGTSSVEVIAIHVLTDETANLSRGSLAVARTLGNGRNEVALADELLAEAVEVLHDGRSRRARVEAMSNGVPRETNLVASTLILDVEEELLRHARACTVLEGGWQGR